MSSNNSDLFLLNSELLQLKDNVHNYTLLESPWLPIAVVSSYTMFIFKLGPKLMKNRDPFSLKTVMMIYNLAQIILNAILFVMVAKLTPNFNMCCSPVSSSNSQEDISIQQLHYYYVVLKFLDMIETVFFVLRKKQSQISLLHTHHHIGMTVTSWATLKYIPGGILFYIFIWNTFVHCVMYIYYLCMSMGTFKAVWWKKHLTQLQLVQHWFFVTACVLHLFNRNCSYPKMVLVYYLGNAALSIFLFTKFYIKNYVRCKNKCN